MRWPVKLRPMRIVIAGGSGFLGSALRQTLTADGHTVVTLTRQPRHPGDVGWSASPSDASWMAALAGADAVVNLAGASIAGKRWTPGRKREILESRIDATAAIVAGLHQTAVPLLISSSAVGIYGSRDDEPLTERSPEGTDFLASVCRAWEAEAMKAPATTTVVRLRTGLVLAREDGVLPQMALPFRFGAGGRVGSGRQYLSWIHRDDWLGLVQWLLQDGGGGIVNATAPVPVTNAEFSATLGRAMHRPALLPAPAFALRLALGEMADALLLGGQRVLPARAEAAGYRFRFRVVEHALRQIYA
jgi:uncharacterized protein